jgi:hypothetical protein
VRVAKRTFGGDGRFRDGDALEELEEVELAQAPKRCAAAPVADGELRRIRDTIWLLVTVFGYKPSQVRQVCKHLNRSERQIQRRLGAVLNAVGGDRGDILDNLIRTLETYREQQDAR